MHTRLQPHLCHPQLPGRRVVRQASAGCPCRRRIGFFAAAYLGLSLIHAPWLVFVELPLFGGIAACADSVGKAWISELVPSHRPGTAQGGTRAPLGAAILLDGLWAGLARQSDGQVPLLVCGTVALTLAAIVCTSGQSDE